jgi:hypothetical protein
MYVCYGMVWSRFYFIFNSLPTQYVLNAIITFMFPRSGGERGGEGAVQV